MSNHFSAANIKSPGGDPRLDFCDLYVFQSPADHDKTVLIMNADPFLMRSEFHPDAVYRLNIDNDGDALADAAFSFVFSEPQGGRQTATALYTTGSQAELPDAVGEPLIEDVPVGFDRAAQPVQAGPVQLFAGVRSDPFFADADGALHGFQWTGQDTFAGKNILSIAVEAPSEMLGPSPEIGVWAAVSLHRDGELVQMDRGGHPTINPFINPDDQKDEYNARQPVDDVANYLEPWSKLLEDKGGYSHDEAIAKARIVLPDILRYDRDQPAAYPNGRMLTDDVYSDRFAWLTNGQAGSDGLTPHDDLMPQFPYLGVPNA
jgi:Domain of unknown function (DUF4331)